MRSTTTSTTMSTERIVQMFSSLCLPMKEGKEDAQGTKEGLILSILEGIGIEASYKEGIGIVVPAVGKRELVVMSHIDLIPSFQTCFANKGTNFSKKPYKIKEKNGEEWIVGALDNTITNAVLLLLIVELRGSGLCKNVEFVFTEREEIGCLGSQKYMETVAENMPDFFVNLDVTNQGKVFAFEMDRLHFPIAKSLLSICDGELYANRVCDDLDSVIEGGGKGFSFCLSTKKRIHSFKNRAKLSSLLAYYEKLKEILLSEALLEAAKKEGELIIPSFEYSQDGCKKIQKAVEECESEEEFKKKISYLFGSFNTVDGYAQATFDFGYSDDSDIVDSGLYYISGEIASSIDIAFSEYYEDGYDAEYAYGIEECYYTIFDTVILPSFGSGLVFGAEDIVNAVALCIDLSKKEEDVVRQAAESALEALESDGLLVKKDESSYIVTKDEALLAAHAIF